MELDKIGFVVKNAGKKSSRKKLAENLLRKKLAEKFDPMSTSGRLALALTAMTGNLLLLLVPTRTLIPQVLIFWEKEEDKAQECRR